MDHDRQLSLYRAMLAARRIDQLEVELTTRGEAFFHVSGSGHEATAALAAHLSPADWLHCHYRAKALLAARGIPLRSFFDNLFCKQNGSSRGRQMNAFFSDPRLHVMSMVTPVANNCLQAVGVAASVKHEPERPIVVCGLGDGSTQQGEFFEAVAEAVRSELPVLFLIEDNGWAISTRTQGRTFYSLPDGPAKDLYGVPVEHFDGRDAWALDATFETLVAEMRATRRPRIVVLAMERLASHTNADDQTLYRAADDIRQAAECGDPIRVYERRLLAAGHAPEDLTRIRDEVAAAVAAAELDAVRGPEPTPHFTAKRPIPVELTHPSGECRGDERAGSLTMRDALREVLRQRLSEDPRVFLYGEDIEDPKGDVFGVTRGLSTQFAGRVVNSPLSEATIVGESIGRALAGQRPVAFLQFADFLPVAFNQIASELATIHWRSDGRWNAPVIIMAACGAYRPGLGPFHAQSMDGLLAHVPGLDVFMPSTAADAAGLLNAAFRSERPTLFLYPKACLNDPERATSDDVARQFVPIGPARKTRVGRDLTFVGWGNTVRLCEAAAQALERVGVEAEVLDLRSLSPWDEHSVLASAAKTARLVVVHEDNHTCGVGAEILATVAEKTRVPVAMRRVTRSDTYVPFNFTNQLEVLPSFKRVLATAAELLNLDLDWIAPPEAQPGISEVPAIGSGPSDETVIVADLLVGPGQYVERGQAVAALEATKSVFELSSPVSGTVTEVCVREGETVPVGNALFRVRTIDTELRPKPVVTERCGKPVLRRKAAAGKLLVPRRDSEPRKFDVGLGGAATITGSRLVTNFDLATGDAPLTPEDIVRRTGIETRHWAAEGETAINLAVKACWKALDEAKLTIDDIDLLVCSTTSPTSVTPSMACQVLNGLSGKSDAMVQAYDINAACSGYLYALQAGYDYLQSTPHGRVLVVTAEVLSPLLDPKDLDTAIIFGDAASATLLYGETAFEHSKARLLRPDLSAKGEDGSTLSVPLLHDGYIQMKGRKVFSEAVRTMIASLTRVCQREGLTVKDLSLVVPHQANGRILEAIQSRIGIDVYNNIKHHGNTSSTSIPLCLSELLPKLHQGEKLGLCAFGGGFTFGAGILVAM